MAWLLYEILFFIGLCLMGPYYLLRMRRRGGYARHFGERFGRYSDETRAKLAALKRPVWVHAVSVGEVQMALALIRQLRQRHADLEIILSTTTSTGYALAKEKEDARLLAIYYPIDSRLCFSAIHRLIRPRSILVMEAELWPNHLLYCKRRGIPLALINARMSDRSYPKYRRLRPIFSRVLACFDLITLQSESDRERLLQLGARESVLQLVGSLKYGAAGSVDEAKRARLLEDLNFLRGRPVLVGASTHAGEEEILLGAWRQLHDKHPTLALVLAPRHVERKGEIVRMLETESVSFVLRSAARSGDVVVLDTTGDLRYVYELASVVFIGKSLCGSGGQNLMEPAWYGKAIVFGPNMQNFRPIVEDFLQSKAAIQVPDPESLRPALESLLNGAGQELGKRAKQLMESKQDVMERTVHAVGSLLAQEISHS